MAKVSIPSFLKRLVAPPVFADEAKSRQAYLVNAVLWVGTLLTVSITVLAFVLSLEIVEFLPFTLAVLLLHLVGFYLLHNGSVRWVANLYPVGLWLLAYSASLAFGRFSLVDAATLLTVTLIAGALVGPRTGFLMAGLSAGALLLAAWLQTRGVFVSQTYESRALIAATTLTVNLVLVAFITWLENRSLAYTQELADQQTSLLLQRSHQLEAAADIGMAAASVHDLNNLLETITTSIAERFDLYFVSIFSITGERSEKRLNLISSAGKPTLRNREAFISMQTGNSIVVHTAKTRQPYLAADVTTDPLYFEVPELNQARSELAVPILVAGELFGVLDLLSAHPTPLGQAELAVMQVLATQVGTAILNARLLESTQRHLEELIALHAVSTASLESKDEDELIARVTHAVGQTLYPRNFGVLLMDAGNDQLIHHASYMESRSNFTAPAIPLGEGITGLVARNAQPLRVADVAAYTRYIPIDPNARSELCVPIKVGERVLGVLNVESEEPDAFSEDDEHLLETLAGQFAISLERIRLLHDANRRAEELAQALDRQEELNRLQNDFIHNVSHEFRTPLSLVSGYVQLLESGDLGPLSQKHQQAIAVIARRTTMLTKLVEDLTAILEVNSRELNHEAVPLADLLRNLRPGLAEQAEAANLGFELELQAETVVVLGEAPLLERVIENLAANAIKFTPTPGEITIRLMADAHNAILEVEDTGIGIPEAEQERIFERFYQVDSGSNRRYGGTGLGLALAREVVELHGGEIELQSRVARGSTFRVLLPLHPGRGFIAEMK